MFEFYVCILSGMWYTIEIRSIRYIIVTLSKIPKGSVHEQQCSDDADIKFELKKYLQYLQCLTEIVLSNYSHSKF